MKILRLIFSLGLIMIAASGTIKISEPIYGNVTPNEGVTYISEHSIYSYQIEIEKLKENSKSQDPLYLQIYNPEASLWLNTSINTSNKSINASKNRDSIINLKIDLAKLTPHFLGLSKFRFVDSKGNALMDRRNGEPIEFIGPNIRANFRNESYKREKSGKYSYSVWVRSYDTIYVGLCGRQSEEDNCEWFGHSIKSNSRGWIKLEWINAPYYRIVEFKIRDKPKGTKTVRYSFKNKAKSVRSLASSLWI